MSYLDRVISEGVKTFYDAHPALIWERLATDGHGDTHLWPHMERVARRASRSGWVYGFATGWITGWLGVALWMMWRALP